MSVLRWIWMEPQKDRLPVQAVVERVGNLRNVIVLWTLLNGCVVSNLFPKAQMLSLLLSSCFSLNYRIINNIIKTFGIDIVRCSGFLSFRIVNSRSISFGDITGPERPIKSKVQLTSFDSVKRSKIRSPQLTNPSEKVTQVDLHALKDEFQMRILEKHQEGLFFAKLLSQGIKYWLQ
ncbi:hypothetical protein VNO80_24274 [Phaseolus coccineus]|uniref:Uncharacterized protein n=1 Tax=Phaseolus coccineus TaxID=3886 RepID=A0AAN9LWZ5_PHACN